MHKTVRAAGVSQNGLPGSGVLTSNRFGNCKLGTGAESENPRARPERGDRGQRESGEPRPMLPASVPRMGECL